MIGWGSGVRTVLSMESFTPLSRLAFGAYLVQPILVEIFVYGGDRKFEFSEFGFWVLTSGFAVLAFICSAIMHLLYEGPLNFRRRAAIRV